MKLKNDNFSPKDPLGTKKDPLRAPKRPLGHPKSPIAGTQRSHCEHRKRPIAGTQKTPRAPKSPIVGTQKTHLEMWTPPLTPFKNQKSLGEDGIDVISFDNLPSSIFALKT